MPEMLQKKSNNLERELHVAMLVLPYRIQSKKAKTDGRRVGERQGKRGEKRCLDILTQIIF